MRNIDLGNRRIATSFIATALVIASGFVAFGVSTRGNGQESHSDAIRPLGIDQSVEVSWKSPPPLTSSRFLSYEIRFSEPVRGVTAEQFVAEGGDCTFNVPSPSSEYASKYSVLMTCPIGTFGTLVPRFTPEAVSTSSLDATPISGESSGRAVEIISGTVMNVEITGSGSGQVTSNLSGINCGLMCTGAFPPGTRLTLTAQAEPGSVFAGWSGACSGTGQCAINLTSSRNVTAQFVPAGTIVVTKLGSGAGSVSATSTSLNCGTSCRSNHRVGQTVTVNATPTRTSRFIGWVGACSGTGPCIVTISNVEDYFLYAIFELR